MLAVIVEDFEMPHHVSVLGSRISECEIELNLKGFWCEDQNVSKRFSNVFSWTKMKYWNRIMENEYVSDKMPRLSCNGRFSQVISDC